jgi:hypothetical protein
MAELEGIMDPGDIDASQEDWVRLCSKYENPHEKDFFKPYWVPIVKDSYDYFIDISVLLLATDGGPDLDKIM